MAHDCPDCGAPCHCGGDIDDIFFEDTREAILCAHCLGKEEEEDDWDDHGPIAEPRTEGESQ